MDLWRQAVQDAYSVSRSDERVDQMRPHKTSAAGDENVLTHPSAPISATSAFLTAGAYLRTAQVEKSAKSSLRRGGLV